MSISVLTIGEPQLAEWESYMDSRPSARAHHSSAWYTVLRQCFRVTPQYLWAIDERGTICGILPMYFSQSVFTGPHLATLDGGALADAPAIAASLYDEAERVRDQLDARYLLVRGAESAHRRATQESYYERTVVDLRGGTDAMWRRLPTAARRGVRSATKRRVTTERDDAALPVFYSLYARRMRELGTPVESPCLFETIRAGLRCRFRLFLARVGGRAIAAILCGAGQTTWTYLYGASDSSALGYHPNDALFWAAFGAASREGALAFDLGASAPATGAHRFKAKWAPRENTVPHVFRYYAANPAPGPFGLDAYRRRRSFRQRLWSRMPLSIATRLGPILRRRLPFG
jgi:CelD/BcsL family acetyltransferase involved in cellulose biosynthesis